MDTENGVDSLQLQVLEIEDYRENIQYSEFFIPFGHSMQKCKLCPFMTSCSSLYGRHIKADHPHLDWSSFSSLPSNISVSEDMASSEDSIAEEEKLWTPTILHFENKELVADTAEIIELETAEPITIDLTLDDEDDVQERELENTFFGNFEIVAEDENGITGITILKIEDSEESGFLGNELHMTQPPMNYVSNYDEISNLSAPISEPPATSSGSNSFHPEDTLNDEFIKPMFTYAQLIYLAIKNSFNDYLVVSEVYLFMTNYFPYFRTAKPSWKNAIRNTLCGRKSLFLQVPITLPVYPRRQRRFCYTLVPDQTTIMKMETDIHTLISHSFPNLSLATPNPENILMLQQGQLKLKYDLTPATPMDIGVENEDAFPLTFPRVDCSSGLIEVSESYDSLPNTSSASYSTITGLQGLPTESDGSH